MYIWKQVILLLAFANGSGAQCQLFSHLSESEVNFIFFSFSYLCRRISFGLCGRFTGAELLSFSLALTIVCVWILTGHWLLMDGEEHGDGLLFSSLFLTNNSCHPPFSNLVSFIFISFSVAAMGMGLCVAFIAFVRLPSLKVSTLLLTGLLVYDVFWVFFSSYIFSANVMVKVATRPADNPVGVMAKKFHFASGMARDAPKLSLPGKLVFPSMHNVGHFSMLGLGDIVIKSFTTLIKSYIIPRSHCKGSPAIKIVLLSLYSRRWCPVFCSASSSATTRTKNRNCSIRLKRVCLCQTTSTESRQSPSYCCFPFNLKLTEREREFLSL